MKYRIKDYPDIKEKVERIKEIELQRECKTNQDKPLIL